MKDKDKLAFALLAAVIGGMVAVATSTRRRRLIPTWGHPLIIYVTGGKLTKKDGTVIYPTVPTEVRGGDRVQTDSTSVALFTTCHSEVILNLGCDAEVLVVQERSSTGEIYHCLNLITGLINYVGLAPIAAWAGLGRGRKYIVKSRGFPVGALATSYAVLTQGTSAVISVTLGRVDVGDELNPSMSRTVDAGCTLVVQQGMPVNTNAPVCL